MKILLPSIFFVCFLSINVFATTPSLATTDWSTTTQIDLQFIQSKIKMTVPYTFIQSNMAFRQQLQQGFSQALSASKGIVNYKQYRHILESYIKGFHLEHVSISFLKNKAKTQYKNNIPSSVKASPFLKNSVWISIPSFQTNNNAQLTKRLQLLIQTIPKYRQKNIIVFDLRHNAGGSSAYARPIIVALYSPKFLRSLGNCFIWNQKWTTLVSLNKKTIKQNNNNPAMIKAYKAGEKLYERIFWPINYGQSSPLNKKIINPVKSKVVILSDSHCGSMCYQFVRTLTQLPNTVLVGQSPNTMERITNPTPYELPSKLATIYIATEEFVSPAHAFGHKITPKYLYSGDIGQTKKIQRWISQIFPT